MVPLARWMLHGSSMRGFKPGGDVENVEFLGAVELQRLARHAAREFQRQHAHADQVGAVDALDAFGDHGAHAEEARAFRRPVARRAHAVILAADDDQRHVFGLIQHRGVVDRHHLAVGLMLGHAAFDAGHHLVADADIGEGAAHHHLVIAAPRAVGIELQRPHLMFEQVGAGRTVGLDIAGGRDMVGGDAVAEDRQLARLDNVGQRPAAPSACR